MQLLRKGKHMTEKQILSELMHNTESRETAHIGVHDGYQALRDLIEGNQSTEAAILQKVIRFISIDGYDCTGFGIDQIWDNRLNGVDEYATSYLIRFLHRGLPQKEFSLDVTGDCVSIWPPDKPSSNIENSLMLY